MSATAKAIWGLLYLLAVTFTFALWVGVFARLWWETMTFGWGLLG